MDFSLMIVTTNTITRATLKFNTFLVRRYTSSSFQWKTQNSKTRFFYVKMRMLATLGSLNTMKFHFWHIPIDAISWCSFFSPFIFCDTCLYNFFFLFLFYTHFSHWTEIFSSTFCWSKWFVYFYFVVSFWFFRNWGTKKIKENTAPHKLFGNSVTFFLNCNVHRRPQNRKTQ